MKFTLLDDSDNKTFILIGNTIVGKIESNYCGTAKRFGFNGKVDINIKNQTRVTFFNDKKFIDKCGRLTLNSYLDFLQTSNFYIEDKEYCFEFNGITFKFNLEHKINYVLINGLKFVTTSFLVDEVLFQYSRQKEKDIHKCFYDYKYFNDNNNFIVVKDKYENNLFYSYYNKTPIFELEYYSSTGKAIRFLDFRNQVYAQYDLYDMNIFEAMKYYYDMCIYINSVINVYWNCASEFIYINKDNSIYVCLILIDGTVDVRLIPEHDICYYFNSSGSLILKNIKSVNYSSIVDVLNLLDNQSIMLE